jgi:hypothetical protein
METATRHRLQFKNNTTEGSCDLGGASDPCPSKEISWLQDNLFVRWGPSVLQRFEIQL